MIKGINHIDGLQEIVGHYEAYIFDLWGVVHDGIMPFQCCIDVMQKLKSYGKTVLILSNSPRRSSATADHLKDMGIEKELYDGIYTSGEDCYDRLRLRDHPWYQNLGRTLFHIGPERNLCTFEGLGYTEVKVPSEADFVLLSGTDGWCTTLDPFYKVLQSCLVSNLPMVCANQDLSIQREGKEYICGGAIAKHYEHEGGNVFYHGKPSKNMFDRLVISNHVTIPKNKMVMIGDSLLTDIPGATAFGIDCILITSGIHWNEHINAQTFSRFNAFPTWVTKRCSW
jgi:HAD superfamily hydrolase (TIGR01459 family)